MQIDGVILAPLDSLAVINVIGKVLEKITSRVPDGLALKSFDPGRRKSERTEKIKTIAFIGTARDKTPSCVSRRSSD
jgi:hypothetical protein